MKSDLKTMSLEIKELRREVIDQWFTNHIEHCGYDVIPWPLPALIEKLLQSEVYSLLLEASGKSF